MKQCISITILILVCIGSLFFFLTAFTSHTHPFTVQQSLTTKHTTFGVYDPDNSLNATSQINMQLIYEPWHLHNTKQLKQKIDNILGKNRLALITIEPWPFNWQGMTQATLFPDIVNGKYDSSISDICTLFSSYSGNTLYVRWGHEMDNDNGTGSFPWSQNDPKAFIGAYQHFVHTCNKYATNVKYIWSPYVTEGTTAYYPGSAYVDYIGIPIFDYIQFDIDHHIPTHSFAALYKQKYAIVSQFSKPIIVTEFGVTGTNTYKASWIKQALKDEAILPNLKEILYFNAIDRVNSWGIHYPAPDWRFTFRF